ncbi:hypothetical protein [Streptomyces sp. NPDC093598]|uniref:hypothetical protein n=1 Tax=Streptomyces sp. NPDC093598 TaxID=3366046 RepID=UPI0037FCC124
MSEHEQRSVLARVGTTNDAYYVLLEHAEAHDNLLCIQVAKNKDDPNRLRFHGPDHYLKTAAQMGTCSPNCPRRATTPC